MAKRSKSKQRKKSAGAGTAAPSTPAPTPAPAADAAAAAKISLADIDAMSSSDDDGGDVTPDAYENNPKAKSLRQAIADGKFDHLLEQFVKKLANSGASDLYDDDDDDDDESDDEFEEVILADDSSSNDEIEEQDQVGEDDLNDEENDDDRDYDKQNEDDSENGNENETADEMGSEDAAISKAVIQEIFKEDKDSSSDSDEDKETPEDPTHSIAHKNILNAKALTLVVNQLEASKSHLPWAETFDIVSSEPLPFGDHNDGSPLDVHDDLKREVAFYNMALDAVHEAKSNCAKAGIPFSRPDDFFAEMVKTDDHMAKVKDRLIFETKKMEAVAQRKANREQKLRAKESHANKLAEKVKRKKDHFQQVADWADTAASQRSGALGDELDAAYLQRMNNGPNKKRQAADRKYGFGGKRGRFKQNDRKTLDDTSSFNWRGNFSGIGTKKRAGGSGSNRKGKRARDASRSRR